MNRRDFIVGTATGLAVGAAGTAAVMRGGKEDAGSAPAVVRQRTEWCMVTTWPEKFPGLGTGADRLAERITRMSDGRLTVKVMAAGTVVPALGAFDAVAQGTAEMGHGAAYYWQGKSKAFNFFAAVPFGLTANELSAWIHFGGGQQLWDEGYARFGLKPFLAGNTGIQMGGWFRKEINTVDDLKGLKMRIGGLAGKILEKRGVVTQQIAGGEVYPALEKGTIDATEWVGPYDDLKLGFYKVAKYYYYPGFWEGGPTLHAFVGLDKWNELPKAYQSILSTACRAANADMLASYDYKNPAALREIVKVGAELRPFSQDIMSACFDTADETYAEIMATNPTFKKIYEDQAAFRRDAYLWAQIADYSYDTFMMRQQRADKL